MQKYRDQFTLYVIGSQPAERIAAKSRLSTAGYRVFDFESGDACLAELRENPPHVVLIFQPSLNAMGLLQFMDLLKSVSPDSLVLPILSPLERSLATRLLERGAWDVVWYFSLEFVDLVTRVDRATQYLLSQFKIEQLTERFDQIEQRHASELEAVQTQFGPDSILESARVLSSFESARSTDDLRAHLVDAAVAAMRTSSKTDTRVLFFRYLPAYKSLLLTEWRGVSDEGARATGLDLREHAPRIVDSLLSVPTQSAELRRLLETTFHIFSYLAFPITASERLRGVLVVESEDTSSFVRERLGAMTRIATTGWQLFELKQTSHEHLETDLGLGILTKRAWQKRLDLEIRRAYRLKSSVSLVYVDLVEMHSLQSQVGADTATAVFRAALQVVSRVARTTDTVGFFDAAACMVVLPETDSIGAGIFIKRVTAALKSVVLPYLSENIVKCGAATYPVSARDAETLIQAALAENDRSYDGERAIEV